MAQKSANQDNSKLIGYCNKPGVTILIDNAGVTQEAEMGLYWSYSPQKKLLTINGLKLRETDEDLLFDIIRKVHEEGELIIKEDSAETLKRYLEYSKANTPDQKILRPLEGVLSASDYNALKMSLFLRSEHMKGESVINYKNDIRQKYGERGATISNLCSAGYFEREFMPSFSEMTSEEFKLYFEIVVAKKARALFIHKLMTPAEVERQFDLMIEKVLKYHMPDFHIHAMGNSNVKVIKDMIASKIIDPDAPYSIRRIFESFSAIQYTVQML